MKHEATRTARRAGLAYIGIIALGIGAEMGLRMPLTDPLSSAETARNIAANLPLWRLSIFADAGMAVLDVTLAILLFRLFRDLGPRLAAGALALRLVQMAIIVAHLPLLVRAIGHPDPLPLIAAHGAGYDLGLWFFGLGTLITALLLWRGRAPAPLVALMAAAGLVYLAGSTTRFIAPDINTAMQMAYLVPMVAETAMALWLLRGARSLAAQPRNAASSSAMSSGISASKRIGRSSAG
ncbi:MAG: DUF4386 domain-containing protein [Pseudooceanicola sp.]